MRINRRSPLGLLLVMSTFSCGGMEDGDLPAPGTEQGDETQSQEKALRWGTVASFNFLDFKDVYTKQRIPGVTVTAALASSNPSYFYGLEVLYSPTTSAEPAEVVGLCNYALSDCDRFPILDLWASHPSYGSFHKAGYDPNLHTKPSWSQLMWSYFSFKLHRACTDNGPCNGYTCNPKTHTCRIACGATKWATCASGYQCVAGACVP